MKLGVKRYMCIYFSLFLLVMSLLLHVARFLGGVSPKCVLIYAGLFLWSYIDALVMR
jgi:hypothetical protein